MKNLKRIASFVLALVMVFALATTAFAAEGEYSITVTNNNENVSIDGTTYNAYKVFDLTLGQPTTDGDGNTTYGAYSYSIKSSDWAWATLTKDATTDEETKVITTKYGIKLTPSASDATQYSVDGDTMTAVNARALADALTSVLPTNAAGTATATDETATIKLSEAGYYAVYGTAVPTDPKGEETIVAALALTTTDPDATVNPKVDAPTLDKKITGEHLLDDDGKAATAQVGSTVSFQIDSVVPDLTGYSDYTFIINDTMTSGLTFTNPEGDATNDVVVKINGEDKTTATTVAIDGQKLTVTIPYATLKAATKGQAIVVTYTAVVNSTALTTDYEKNTAYLTYSNNPSDNTTNDTPEKTVYVIDVDINVNKVAGDTNGDALANAVFMIFKGAATPADDTAAWYQWDEANNVVKWVAKADADTFTTNAEGKFTTAVQGLEAEAAGTTYGLLETKAPTGYNLLDAPVIVTLTGAYSETEGAETATVTASANATVTNGTVNLSADQNANQPLATVTVINESGATLPSTGGVGTTMFYIIGGLMVAAAVVLLVTKKRMAAAE